MKSQLRPLHDFAEDDNKAIALQKRSYSTGILINSLQYMLFTYNDDFMPLYDGTNFVLFLKKNEI